MPGCSGIPLFLYERLHLKVEDFSRTFSCLKFDILMIKFML